ncbi:MAG: rhomboid family intramembrane serine protease [Porphyromonadaceae bacterium]|nr:rhomboid family intramembrane serine protease [Porphyromonadaceae bacterium]
MIQNRQSFLSSIPPVTKNLIIINLLLWLATIVFRKVLGIDLVDYLGLHYFQATRFNAVQFVTYMFMHDPYSFGHVFFNMFSVFIFGRTLEAVWGGQRFLVYYIITGIGAGFIQEITWYYSLHEAIVNTEAVVGWMQTQLLLNNAITIGASGAVFGILLAFGMLFPNAELFLLFIPIPIKAKYFVIGYGLIELFLGIQSSSGSGGDNIAHFAHLGGMLFGLILILYWKKKGGGTREHF